MRVRWDKTKHCNFTECKHFSQRFVVDVYISCWVFFFSSTALTKKRIIERIQTLSISHSLSQMATYIRVKKLYASRILSSLFARRNFFFYHFVRSCVVFCLYLRKTFQLVLKCVISIVWWFSSCLMPFRINTLLCQFVDVVITIIVTHSRICRS